MFEAHDRQKQNQPSHFRPRDVHRAEAFSVRMIDGCLFCCIFVVPMLMGGRQALGQFVLVVAAVLAALAWAVQQSARHGGKWRRSGAEWLLTGCVALVLLQLAPLPHAWYERLASHSSAILPLWQGGGEATGKLGDWSRVSLTPAATRAGLILLVAYALLFLVTVQRIQGVGDVERLLRWCAFSAVLMAVFALVQYLTSNGRFFWCYEHPYSSTNDAVKGAFTNRNHLAHFLALSLGPIIWWVQSGGGKRSGSTRWDREPRFGDSTELFSFSRIFALGVVLLAGLLTLSRGGALAMLLAAAVAVAVQYRAKRAGLKFVGVSAVVALVVGASLFIHGFDRVSNRLDDFSAGSVDELDSAGARRAVWTAAIHAIPDFPILGSGVGSHVEVNPMYLESTSPKEFTHAENGYLQIGLETGLAGLCLLGAAIILCVWWCARALWAAPSTRAFVCAGAIAATLAASGLHSGVDFVWYVPGCTAVLVILIGAVCRLQQLAARKGERREQETGGGHSSVRQTTFAMPRPIAVSVVGVLVGLGVWIVATRAGSIIAELHWHHYLIVDRTSEGAPRDDAEATVASSLPAAQEKIDALEQVVRWDPGHARAHIRLAAAYLHYFDLDQSQARNAMPLVQIRDAYLVTVARCGTARARQWLAAPGVLPRRDLLEKAANSARRGLALCPLQGRGYVYLADLCFLEDDTQGAKQAYLAQALIVRPHDGAVLMAAGSEAVLAGRLTEGLEFWQRSFHSGWEFQRQLIEMLARRGVPPEFMLEKFDPPLPALRLLHEKYREFLPDEALIPLRRRYVCAMEDKAKNLTSCRARHWWLQAAEMHQSLEDTTQAVECAEMAIRSDPANYAAHFRLAGYLAEAEQFDAAIRQLRWCLARKPDHRALPAKFKEITEKRADLARSASAAKGGLSADDTTAQRDVSHGMF
ncbi:MAG: O-antigen ligase family protein [Planctomycetes bacterium]|nr:O-antigen ligase family protein [Planctomycetota bacterium]